MCEAATAASAFVWACLFLFLGNRSKKGERKWIGSQIDWGRVVTERTSESMISVEGKLWSNAISVDAGGVQISAPSQAASSAEAGGSVQTVATQTSSRTRLHPRADSFLRIERR